MKFELDNRNTKLGDFSVLKYLLMIATLFTIGLGIVHADSTLPAAPATPIATSVDTSSGKPVLLERTAVVVVLQEQLKSGDSKEGQDVQFKTSEDIYGDGHTLLIPAGAEAWGTIIKSSGHGAWGKSGKLNFTCNYVVAPDKTKVPLRSESMAVKGKENTATEVGGFLAFGIFGGFVKGRDVTVHKGQTFTMYVDKDTQIQPAVVTAERQTSTQPSKTLFTLNDGTQIVGVVQSLSNGTYSLATDQGAKSINVSDVKSMYLVANG